MLIQDSKDRQNNQVSPVTNNFNVYLDTKKDRINSFLEQIFAQFQGSLNTEKNANNLSNDKTNLNDALYYSVFNGGKRLRPLLTYITGEIFGAPLNVLDAAAGSVELIHCYSLIHDDLPAMDNDDLRRGLPTCHKAFNEATAILAGDALQTLSFELLSSSHWNPISDTQKLAMIQCLAQAAGPKGMVLGQSLDINNNSIEELTLENLTLEKPTLEDLQLIHTKKTGCLIAASIMLGAIAANVEDSNTLKILQEIGLNIGLIFQIKDDILDVEGKTEVLGKQAGQDEKQNKSTFPKLLGLTPAKEMMLSLYEETIVNVKNLKNLTNLNNQKNETKYNPEKLIDMIQYFVEREY